VHVVWINERADFVGGVERYIVDTAPLLRDRGVRSTLLYGVAGWTAPGFTKRFDAAFPLVDIERQLDELEPDVVYVHQLADREVVERLARARVPAIRFFHDHALFCLREHKYTTLGQNTCTRTVGVGCYPCLGFVNRADTRVGVRLRTLGSVRRDQRANARLDAFVVGSKYMRDHVIAHGFDPARVHHNPLFVWPVEPPDDVDRDPDLLLFVGGLLRGKGLDLLLEALRDLPSRVRLRVVGTGRQRELFESTVRDLGVAERVELVGFLDRAELDRAYAEAACVVVPSRSPETFALVGPEALVRGAPVVATAVGGVGEWLEDEVTGLSVPSGDAPALATAIRRILDDPAAARRMAEEGRRRCLERLSPERHASTLLSLFRSVGAS
jgi:glycosyltransferase involved in cell wall biosynthesis